MSIFTGSSLKNIVVIIYKGRAVDYYHYLFEKPFDQMKLDLEAEIASLEEQIAGIEEQLNS